MHEVERRHGTRPDGCRALHVRPHPQGNQRGRSAPPRAGEVVAVADIPRTKSGKIAEPAARHVVHRREVKNKEALANSKALELCRGLPELAD